MMKGQMRGAVATPLPAASPAAGDPPAVPQPAPADSSMGAAQLVAEGNRLLSAGNPVESEKMFSTALVMIRSSSARDLALRPAATRAATLRKRRSWRTK